VCGPARGRICLSLLFSPSHFLFHPHFSATSFFFGQDLQGIWLTVVYLCHCYLAISFWLFLIYYNIGLSPYILDPLPHKH
jgi:hypothetical protein